MANKPLFLVAAAMLMLIFFTGTAHASVTATISPSGPISFDYSSATNPNTVLMTYTGSGSSSTLTYSIVWIPVATGYGGCDFEQSGFSNNQGYTIGFPTGGYTGTLSGSCTTTPYANGMEITPSGSPYTIQFTATDTSNGADKAIVTDTVYVNPDLNVPTLGISPSTMDNGQSSTVTVSWTGGTPDYTVTLYSSSTSSCSSSSTEVSQQTGIAGDSATFSVNPSSNTYYCASVTDSSYINPETEVSQSSELTVNPAPAITTPVVVPSKIDLNAGSSINGQTVTITGTASGGTPPYEENYGGYVATGVFQSFNGGSMGNSEISPCTINGDSISCTVNNYNQGSGTYRYAIFLTDSVGGTATSTASNPVTVNPALIAGAITPSSPTIDSGQSITLTANPSGGTPSYSYTWYASAGSTAPTCISANLISGATGSTYSASPTSTESYAYQVTDSASTPVSACSSGDTVTVNPQFDVTAPTLSNTTIDAGQNTLMSTTILGGTPPFTGKFYTNLGTCATGGSLSSQTIATSSDGQQEELIITTGNGFNFGGNSPSLMAAPCHMQIDAIFKDNAYSPASVTSTNTTLTLNSALTVTTPSLTNTTLDQGQSSQISSSASGGSGSVNLRYQWYENINNGGWTQISGATSPTYKFVSTTSTTPGGYEFKLKVTDTGTSNDYYVNSSQNGLKLYAAPTITLVPEDARVTAGQPATFTAKVTGGVGPFNLQLYNITVSPPVATSSTGTINSPGESVNLTYTPTNLSGSVLA